MVKAKSVSRRKQAPVIATKNTQHFMEDNMFKCLMLNILIFKQEERSYQTLRKFSATCLVMSILTSFWFGQKSCLF